MGGTFGETSQMDKLNTAREQYSNGYYSDQLEIGLQFQDVITRELYIRGIVVVGFSSRRFQNECGENMLGAEIKRDGFFRETGNLYIEVAEKSHPDNPLYIPSGIMRDDNSWLFVIGDEKTVWIFATVYLRKLVACRGYRKVQKPTSIGYLLPLREADKYAIRKLEL